MTIRKSLPKDTPSIFNLIKELAEFENGLHHVTLTEEQLEKDKFEHQLYDCFVAEIEEKVVGISLYYFRYSTWKGKKLYLEDIVINENFKRKGIGKALLDATIEEAKNTNCTGIMWQVLDWNESAIEFYKKYPVTFDAEWLNVSMNF